MFSSVYAPASRSDNPMPRLSKAMTRANEPKRSKKRAIMGKGRHDLEVADEPSEDEQVDVAGTALRVGDGDIAVVGIANRCPGGHGSA